MINVFTPKVNDADVVAVANALRIGEISGIFGKSINNFENYFAKFVGCDFGVATTSGTTALHLALAAAGVGEGDEVIVSSSTNIATALAPIYLGAIPIPADVKEDSWNIDPECIERLINNKTKAIIPVHLFGNPANMDQIMEISRKYGLLVIEDCAQAHGAKWKGKPVGSFGHMAAFSFYANKIITTGEGGMVVTNDDNLADKMRYLKNLAFGEPRFLHRDIGFNYRMTAFQAALGLSQLNRIDTIIEKKIDIYNTYKSLLINEDRIIWQNINEEAYSSHWMVGFRIDRKSCVKRDEFAISLYNNGIETRNFFCPMNQQPALISKNISSRTYCPVSDYLWEDGIYIPSGLDLDIDNQIYIVDNIIKALNG